MARGRPRLPEGEALQHVSLRLPKWVIDWYDAEGKRSETMRLVLEGHTKRDS